MQADRVHDRGEHAHMVAGDAVAARLGDRHAAEDVAAADHQADLDAEGHRLADLARDPVDDRLVDTEGLGTQ